MIAEGCDGQPEPVQEVIDASARRAVRPGMWFWLRDLETGLTCRMCDDFSHKYVWIDATGRAWQMCRRCDVDPSAPPRRRHGS